MDNQIDIKIKTLLEDSKNICWGSLMETMDFFREK